MALCTALRLQHSLLPHNIFFKKVKHSIPLDKISRGHKNVQNQPKKNKMCRVITLCPQNIILCGLAYVYFCLCEVIFFNSAARILTSIISLCFFCLSSHYASLQLSKGQPQLQSHTVEVSTVFPKSSAEGHLYFKVLSHAIPTCC